VAAGITSTGGAAKLRRIRLSRQTRQRPEGLQSLLAGHRLKPINGSRRAGRLLVGMVVLAHLRLPLGHCRKATLQLTCGGQAHQAARQALPLGCTGPRWAGGQLLH